jgi:regulator of cell morphogenesis and NO signaling
MSDLIDADYRLLLLLMRLDIPLGFGRKSVEDVCLQNDFDPDCFIFLVNFQYGMSGMNIRDEFDRLPFEPFLVYLKKSHAYFLENRLPNIRRKLKAVFSKGDKDRQEIVLRFFDQYLQEVLDHMQYEDEIVFPYVRSLVNEENANQYSIAIFEERHNNIDDKVSDLKRILMNYVSGVDDQKLMTNILLELYLTQDELANHTFIEDELIIPRVKNIEAKRNDRKSRILSRKSN